MVAACVAITDCIASLPLLSSTATEMVLWWTSRPIYLMLSIGCSFREVGYCFAQQPYPTAKGAPFYNACPHPGLFCLGGSFAPALVTGQCELRSCPCAARSGASATSQAWPGVRHAGWANRVGQTSMVYG